MKELVFTIHTDGGARGNPGPAACSFVVEADGAVIHKSSKYLGKETNNFAEYQGVILALEWINENGDKFLGQTIKFFLDSELVVRQLNGIYKIKNKILQELNFKTAALIKNSGAEISFGYVPRTKNKIADFLVNKELDKSA
jgi:ribonuclease HI